MGSQPGPVSADGEEPTPRLDVGGGAVMMHPHPPYPPTPPRLTLDMWGLSVSRAHHTSVLDVINLECFFFFFGVLVLTTHFILED